MSDTDLLIDHDEEENDSGDEQDQSVDFKTSRENVIEQMEQREDEGMEIFVKEEKTSELLTSESKLDDSRSNSIGTSSRYSNNPLHQNTNQNRNRDSNALNLNRQVKTTRIYYHPRMDRVKVFSFANDEPKINQLRHVFQDDSIIEVFDVLEMLQKNSQVTERAPLLEHAQLFQVRTTRRPPSENEGGPNGEGIDPVKSFFNCFRCYLSYHRAVLSNMDKELDRERDVYRDGHNQRDDRSNKFRDNFRKRRNQDGSPSFIEPRHSREKEYGGRDEKRRYTTPSPPPPPSQKKFGNKIRSESPVNIDNSHEEDNNMPMPVVVPQEREREREREHGREREREHVREREHGRERELEREPRERGRKRERGHEEEKDKDDDIMFNPAQQAMNMNMAMMMNPAMNLPMNMNMPMNPMNPLMMNPAAGLMMNPSAMMMMQAQQAQRNNSKKDGKSMMDPDSFKKMVKQQMEFNMKMYEQMYDQMKKK